MGCLFKLIFGFDFSSEAPIRKYLQTMLFNSLFKLLFNFHDGLVCIAEYIVSCHEKKIYHGSFY